MRSPARNGIWSSRCGWWSVRIESQSAAASIMSSIISHLTQRRRARGVPATGASAGGSNYTALGVMTLNNPASNDNLRNKTLIRSWKKQIKRGACHLMSIDTRDSDIMMARLTSHGTELSGKLGPDWSLLTTNPSQLGVINFVLIRTEERLSDSALYFGRYSFVVIKIRKRVTFPVPQPV